MENNVKKSLYRETIEKMVAKVRKKYPHITDDMLYEGGAIFYQNGVNGTEFDVEVNRHLPVFSVFFTDKENGKGMAFIRVLVSNKTADAYVYEHGEMMPTDTIKLSHRVSYTKWGQVMEVNADWKRLFDTSIDKIVF